MKNKWIPAAFPLLAGLMAFSPASALEEQITEQSFAAEGISEYQRTVTASGADLSEEAETQLQLIADNLDLWAGDREFTSTYQYAVTDLDQNGRLEILVSTCQGTGLFTYSSYYEVNEALDGLNACEQDLEEGASEADLMYSAVPVYCDTEEDIYFYVFDDMIRNGYAELYENKRAISLSDGVIRNQFLAYRTTLSQDSTPVITCTDADGADISEETYDSIGDIVFADLEKRTASLSWQSPENGIESLDSTSLLELLTDSCCGFQIF